MSFAQSFAPVAVTTRSGHHESVHFGAAVLLDSDGSLMGAIGDPDVEIYPRSSNKPMQADAMLALGAELTSQQLALACASHDGSPTHLGVVLSTLASVGLDSSALENTPSFPLDPAAHEAALRAGAERSALAMNCSGKHAAMLATCVRNGWPIDQYLHRDHPLQRAIDGHIERLAGPVTAVGIDGCGAPAHVLSLTGLATGFAALARAENPVFEAMTQHPELVGGEHRPVTRLMRAVPGLMAKDGAEGVFAAALPDGCAVAVKIADGASRAAAVVLAGVLAHAGVDINPADLADPIMGHGQPVGRIELLFDKLVP